MILGDLGAEVLKIEMPGEGDDTRRWGPPFIDGESAYFLSLNRNKKSVTLNLKTETGRRVLHELASKTDVIVENFRPGVTERLEIDYDTLSTVNPKLIYCSISSFGQTGPYKDRVAYDIIIQAMSGLMGITGEEGRPPVRVGIAVSDIAAAMFASTAILSALYERERTERGKYVDISLLDSTVAWMTYMAGNFFATANPPTRMGSSHPNIVPYQCFETKDNRYLAVAAANDKLWRKLCKEANLEELTIDPRFASNPDRVRNREELVKILEKAFLNRTGEEWIEQLWRAGIPCGPVNDMRQVFSDPQVLHRNMLREVEHSTAGCINQIGSPMKLEDTEVQLDSPPLLGQHTEDVLKDQLGLSGEEIESMRREEVI
jgi:crotonobetainyl-CoA:carnitine CoA-transferase CaiB-like acyl-CoA transferase